MPAFSKLSKVLPIMLSAFVLMSCSSKKNSLENKQANLYFGAGTQSLMAGEYTEALKNLLQANKLRPNDSEILNNLGMTYYLKGERELALRSFDEALKINKDNSDAKINIASIHFKEKEFKKAEALYKEVLRDLTYDKQARTYFNLGMIEVEYKRDLNKAEEYFKKSAKEDENYCPAHYQLGLIYYTRKQFNTALRNFKDASMGICYNSPAPIFHQALTLIELRNYEDARIKLNEIETRFGKTPYAARARAKVIELNGMLKNRMIEAKSTSKMLESPEF